MKCLRCVLIWSFWAVDVVALVQLWVWQPHVSRCPGWFAFCRERRNMRVISTTATTTNINKNGNLLSQLFIFKRYTQADSRKRPLPSDFGKAARERQARFVRPQHPLDPLTFSEYQQIRTILANKSVAMDSSPYIHAAGLEEPTKEEILSWKEGELLSSRKAFVITTMGGMVYKSIIDLSANTVESQDLHQGSGKPSLTLDDMIMASTVALEYPEFLETLKSRSLDKKEVVCIPFSVGWYNKDEEVQEEDEKRLIKVQCYNGAGSANYYMQPIEGITLMIDLDAKKVVMYWEYDSVPLPKSEGTDFRLSAQKSSFPNILNPISLEQPDGPSFSVEGHKVKWGNWEFYVKPDYRVGSIIYQASIGDLETGALRSVLYKGFASELFVTYMDPTEGWYFRSSLDAGEYGLGLMCMSLKPLNDCPRNAYYMDGVFVDAQGRPYIRPNMLCIFERYSGDVAWRHTESPITHLDVQLREVRPKLTLVVRVIASVRNHDYILDWEFQTDGLIRAKVGVTGILMVKSTPHDTLDEATESNEELFGTILAEKTVGVVHDHFVTFYLDLDIDGTENTFVQSKLVKKRVPKGMSPRRSYWGLEELVAKIESDGKVKISHFKPAEYKVINSARRTRIGNPISYKIVPGKTAGSLLELDDPPQMRASFTNNQMWVTPYNQSEEYAGGFFAYQSHGEDTVSRWTRRDRPIENEDIIVWYTVGLHHIPCQEDFPVMPTVTESFELKPNNFFESNPIMRAHPHYEEDLPQCTGSA